MRRIIIRLLVFVIPVLMLTGCGERINNRQTGALMTGAEASGGSIEPGSTSTDAVTRTQDETERQTEDPVISPQRESEAETEEKTPQQTEKTAETETEKAAEKPADRQQDAQTIIKAVDYTSKDSTVKITLPDNSWKVTLDTDANRVFQSENVAMITIEHASTEATMKALTLMTSQSDLEAALLKQYTSNTAYEIDSYQNIMVGDIGVYRYAVHYKAPTRMWAYVVTNAVVAEDEAYIVKGTVTDDDEELLKEVRTAVESFLVLSDEKLNAVTGLAYDEIVRNAGKLSLPGTASGEAATLQTYSSLIILQTNDGVNIREEPGTDSTILDSVDPNTQLYVSGETTNWYQVYINGYYGYIRKDFMSYPVVDSQNTSSGDDSKTQKTSTGNSDQVQAELTTAVVYGSETTLYAVSEVNIRALPGIESDIIGVLAGGESVTATGETDSWFVVSVGGQTGYISKGFLVYDKSYIGSVPEAGNMEQGQDGSPTVTTVPAEQPEYLTFISGTVEYSTLDTITVRDENGNLYTVYYGDADVSSPDGIYEGIAVSISLNYMEAYGDILYATNVVGYH